MDIAKPTDAELAAIRAEHSYRFPQQVTLAVDGDAEKRVQLFAVVGNPSGACAMPEGKQALPAWDSVVAATFKMRPDAEVLTEQLAADCVLWPDPATWMAWVQRWPGLPEVMQRVLRQKAGSAMALLEEPQLGEKQPEAVAALAARHPAAVWRRLKPPGRALDAVIDAPGFGVWRMFVESMKRRDAKPWQLARDLALSSVRGLFDQAGAAVSPGDLLARFPGQALLIGLVVSHLSGLTAEFELGE